MALGGSYFMLLFVMLLAFSFCLSALSQFLAYFFVTVEMYPFQTRRRFAACNSGWRLDVFSFLR